MSAPLLLATACSGEAETNEEWGGGADWGSEAEGDDAVAASDSDTGNLEATDGEPAESPQQEPPKSDPPPRVAASEPEYFYCDPVADGRNYFFVDPDNPDRGFAGFEFSPSYEAANPDETAPITELRSAVSGSGMRYVNDGMEFIGKAENGMLTLSDGTTLNCTIGG